MSSRWIRERTRSGTYFNVSFSWTLSNRPDEVDADRFKPAFILPLRVSPFASLELILKAALSFISLIIMSFAFNPLATSVKFGNSDARYDDASIEEREMSKEAVALGIAGKSILDSKLNEDSAELDACWESDDLSGEPKINMDSLLLAEAPASRPI